MNRSEFLQRTGLASLAALLPLTRTQAAVQALAGAAAAGSLRPASPHTCVLIPGETAGPYPLNLSGNAAMFRQDIRENRVGTQLDITLKVFGIRNCGVMPNLRVDIWHCDKDGYYSGYTTSAHLGQQNHAGETWLRGIQLTDANGEVRFTTIFPGWYPGRVSHVHFQVFLNSVLQATSQFTFPVATKNQIYTTDPNYATYGADPMALTADNVFADGYANQMATLTPNATTGGWDAYFEVGINSSGVLGMLAMAPETGGQLTLGQNYPNPYLAETTVPFTLLEESDVTLSLFDLMGRRVARIERPGLAAGEQQIPVRPAELGLAAAHYAYELRVRNRNGEYHATKLMTAAR